MNPLVLDVFEVADLGIKIAGLKRWLADAETGKSDA